MAVATPDPFAMLAERLEAGVRARSAIWKPEAQQMPPPGEPGRDWLLWLALGGRGSGKTDVAAHFLDQHARAHPGYRYRIIAPTLGDARESCVEGPSGLLAHNPSIDFNVSKYLLHWPNGSRARLFGAHTPEDVERLRAGGNAHVDWYEELAAWRYLDDTLDQAEFGLRLGPAPFAIASSTPKPKKRFVSLAKASTTAVTKLRTADNPHLAETRRRQLYDRYAGTRLGRQELEAEILEDIEGAMWQWGWIEENRVEQAPELVRIVVPVDPAVTHGDDSDESGIAGVGLGADGDFYVLASSGYRLSPAGWATKAIDLYDELAADRIIAERNNGGDMVESTIRQVRRDVPVKTIVASRGKTVRAEPVAALYEQGRVHHVGMFAELEEQQTTFPIANELDDQLDAVVYGVTELMAPFEWGVVE